MTALETATTHVVYRVTKVPPRPKVVSPTTVTRGATADANPHKLGSEVRVATEANRRPRAPRASPKTYAAYSTSDSNRDSRGLKPEALPISLVERAAEHERTEPPYSCGEHACCSR